jgi:hypothetical protein
MAFSCTVSGGRASCGLSAKQYGCGPQPYTELCKLMVAHVQQEDGVKDIAALQAYADANDCPQNFHIHCCSQRGDSMILHFWTSPEGIANVNYCNV